MVAIEAKVPDTEKQVIGSPTIVEKDEVEEEKVEKKVDGEVRPTE